MVRYIHAILALGASLTLAGTARAQLLSDNFSGPTASQPWQVYGTACLTAGSGAGTIPACPTGVPGGYTGTTPDSSGNGALMLTQALRWQSGGIVSLNSFPSSGGFTVTFSAASFGGDGADGISFFLLDAAAGIPAQLGLDGGGLGYARIPGGFLGIGIDEFGNFANVGCGNSYCLGGPGFSPNTVSVRGPTSLTNPFIAQANPGFSLWSNVNNRRRATVRTYQVSMSPEGLVSVAINGVPYVSNLNAKAMTGSIPANLRVGIAASTGATTNIHQILAFSVTALQTSNLAISKVATVLDDPINGTVNPKAIPGARVRYCTIVTNLPGGPVATGVTVAEAIAILPITFIAGSIRINGTAADGVCAANGVAGGSFTDGTVRAGLADIAGGANTTMTFEALLN